MAEISISNFLSLINQQIEFQENFNEYLSKVDALLEIVMDDGFLNHSQTLIYYYFWTIYDVIKHIKKMNEDCLNTLLKNQKRQ